MYYQGNSEIQADGLQTLYLMNPNYDGYSDTSHQSGNMLILNYASGNPINLENLPNGQPPPPQPHLVGVPLQAATGSGNLQDLMLNHLTLHSPHEVQPPRWWSAIDQTVGGNQENTHIPSGVVVSSGSGGGPAEVSVAQLGYHMPVVSPTRQALSLSLSSQQSGYRSLPMDHNINQVGLISPRTGGGGGSGSGGSGENYRASSSSVSVITHGMPGGHGVVLGTKYLKAAQELLDEVVKIEAKENKNEVMEKGKEKAKMEKESMVMSGEASGVGQIGETSKAELTTAQKQEIQMRKAKLVSMLDEVEQRYRQYHHHMQIVVTSFEQATGAGSARSYTRLALQTISKQFRCLKDAISAQIKAASKSLGEEDGIGGKIQGSSSRLKFVDQQIRQERAMQQLGIMQNNNVWRPQRGLPERAVSVLRAWLFEHFLHPYPKDSDKLMLAKQTGLTRSQVSNWFINARVRLWKPMVEEMYTEEMKNQEGCSESNKNSRSKSTSPKDISTPRIDQDSTFRSKQANKRMSQEETPEESSSASGFGLVSELNPEKNPKKLRSDMQNFTSNNPQVDMDTQLGDPRGGVNAERPIKERFTTQMMGNSQGNGSGFVGFSLGELGQFNPEQLTTGFHGNGVSLTLGLPPSETLPLSGSQQNYLSDQNMELRSSLEMGSVQGHYDRVHKPQPPPHANMGYDDAIEFENRKRFAAQFLPDFVS